MGEAALLLGNYRPSLTVARKLSCAGYRIIVGKEIDGGRESSIDFSRYVSETWQHPSWASNDSILAASLKERINVGDIAVIFPVSETALLRLNAIRTSLPHNVTLVSPSPSVVECCTDKGKTLELCCREGIDHAPYRCAGSMDELRGAAASVGFPCVIKPMVAATRKLFGDKKAVICPSPGVFEETFSEWPEGHAALLVQRAVFGARFNVYYAAQGGVLKGGVQIRVGRTDRSDGTGLAVDGCSVAPIFELMRSTENLVAAMNYTGVGCAQFLHDESTDVYSFLELNPRLGANYAVVEYCGLPLTEWAVQLAKDVDLPQRDVWKYRTGVRYAWTRGDLAGWRFERKKRRITRGEGIRWLGEMLRSFALAKVHITWSWRDPLPAILEFIRPAWFELRLSVINDGKGIKNVQHN